MKMINTDKLEGFIKEEWYDSDFADTEDNNIYDLHFFTWKKNKEDMTVEVANTYRVTKEGEHFESQTVSIWIGEYEQVLPHINSNAKLHLLLWILEIS